MTRIHTIFTIARARPSYRHRLPLTSEDLDRPRLETKHRFYGRNTTIDETQTETIIIFLIKFQKRFGSLSKQCMSLIQAIFSFEGSDSNAKVVHKDLFVECKLSEWWKPGAFKQTLLY